MDWLFCLLYSIYRWFANLAWLCKRNNVAYFFLVGSDGKQHPLNEANVRMYTHLLVIYYTPAGTRYRFRPLDSVSLFTTVRFIKRIYQTYEEPKGAKLYAVNATILERVHTLNALEFNVVGNEIFTPIFNLWLCQNYLHIAPTDKVEVSYIDESTSICVTNGPIVFDDEGMKVKTTVVCAEEETEEPTKINFTTLVT